MSVRRTTLFLTAAGAAVLIALSGCASDRSDTASSGSGGKADAPGAAPQEQGGAGPQQDNAQGSQNNPAKVPDNLDIENRSIIYAGTMTVRVKDVDVAAAQAIAFATGAGGFIGGDNRQHDDLRSQGTLTLRIPAAKFTTTLEQLKTLGNEENRQVTAQDVTDQVVDVAARLQTAQASVDRIRTLLAKAQTIAEITSLESELSRREADLESLQARKRRLDGLTALSTITLVLLGPEAAVDKEDTGILVGLKSGWSAFKTSLDIALTVLGWLVPWIVLVGGPIFLLVWLLRRFRPKRPALAVAGAGMPPLPPVTAAPPPFPGGRPAPGRPMPPMPGPFLPPPPAGPAPASPPPPPAGAVSSPPPAGTVPVSAPPAGTVPVSAPPAGTVSSPPPPPAGTVSAPPPPAGTVPVSAPPSGAGAPPMQEPGAAAPAPPIEEAAGEPAQEEPKGPSEER